MQVLSLGMMRTGTMSMQRAFHILGIPCWHGAEQFLRRDTWPGWQRALEAKFAGRGEPYTRADWDGLLGDFGAVTDVPAIAFADDLIAAYPEAKVVLSSGSATRGSRASRRRPSRRCGTQ
jgi:hypothetical protein